MSIRCTFFLLVIGFAAVPIAGLTEQADTVNFSFGKERSYVQTLTVTTKQNLMVSQPRIEKTVSVSEMTLAKSVSGWTMSVKPVSMELFQDGRRVGDPMAKMKARIGLTYQLDSAGQLQDIGGFDEFIADLANDMGEPMADTMAQMLDIPGLKNVSRHDWDRRFGLLVGKQFVLGESQVSQSLYELPDGTDAVYPVTTTVSKAVSCPIPQCVQIDEIYGTAQNNTVTPEVGSGGPVVTGNSQRLLNAQTMEYFEYVSSLRVHFHKSIAFDGSNAGYITQTRVYEYE
ncbi:MAG: hypothetical protein AB8B96_16435 [Lysobacterales bacterium]